MPRARNSGFTFFELLLVVSIVGVMAAMVAPRLSGTFRRGEIESAASDVALMLRQARHAAVMRSDGAELRIDPETGRYQVKLILLDDDGQPAGEEEESSRPSRRRSRRRPEPFRLSADAKQVRALPARVFFTVVHSTAPRTEDGLPRIMFYPDGSATAGWIGIQNEAGKALKIEVYRTTGMAMVDAGTPVIPAGEQPLFVRGDGSNLYETR